MLNFVDTRQPFIDASLIAGVNPQIAGILSKIKDYTHQSVSVLTDTVSLIVKRGNDLIPTVEIHCNLTGHILAKRNVGYWECECDFLACGYALLDECYLDDNTLSDAQNTLNMLMCDCPCGYDGD